MKCISFSGDASLFFCSLINHLVPISSLEEARENRNPVHGNVRVRLENHFAHVFITLVLQFFDSSFN